MRNCKRDILRIPHIYLETSHVRDRDGAIRQLMGEASEMPRKPRRGWDTLLALVGSITLLQSCCDCCVSLCCSTLTKLFETLYIIKLHFHFSTLLSCTNLLCFRFAIKYTNLLHIVRNRKQEYNITVFLSLCYLFAASF